MARRLASLLPRFVALPLIALFGTATLTFAADRQLTAPASPPQPTASAVTQVVVVPDVSRQAFVFAKGTLEDAGFAWKVVGPVQGYAANTVASQSPAAGTRVVDTGAPVIQLRLRANKSYGQKGSPENAAPWAGTSVKVAGAATPEKAPAAVPAAPKPVKAAPKPKPKAAPKPRTARPPAFVVAGAPREPLDEMRLTDRATLLGKYVAAHPKPTNTAVQHFLYQHSWIVTGAQFGWWKGAKALRILIEVDRKAQATWGSGSKSEAVARAALAKVGARTK
jgi:PASTA domain-containing protein